jgi:hypothetical protein
MSAPSQSSLLAGQGNATVRFRLRSSSNRALRAKVCSHVDTEAFPCRYRFLFCQALTRACWTISSASDGSIEYVRTSQFSNLLLYSWSNWSNPSGLHSSVFSLRWRFSMWNHPFCDSEGHATVGRWTHYHRPHHVGAPRYACRRARQDFRQSNGKHVKLLDNRDTPRRGSGLSAIFLLEMFYRFIRCWVTAPPDYGHLGMLPAGGAADFFWKQDGHLSAVERTMRCAMTILLRFGT